MFSLLYEIYKAMNIILLVLIIKITSTRGTTICLNRALEINLFYLYHDFHSISLLDIFQ